MTLGITLIGCGRKKLAPSSDGVGHAARDLYTGNVFRARRAYAERRSCAWFIVSGLHGLLLPNELVQPYDFTLTDAPWLDRCGWALAVASDLLAQLPERAREDLTVIELHAGAAYVDPLTPVLQALGFVVQLPVARLGVGEQLAFYKNADPSSSQPREQPDRLTMQNARLAGGILRSYGKCGHVGDDGAVCERAEGHRGAHEPAATP